MTFRLPSLFSSAPSDKVYNPVTRLTKDNVQEFSNTPGVVYFQTRQNSLTDDGKPAWTLSYDIRHNSLARKEDILSIPSIALMTEKKPENTLKRTREWALTLNECDDKLQTIANDCAESSQDSGVSGLTFWSADESLLAKLDYEGSGIPPAQGLTMDITDDGFVDVNYTESQGSQTSKQTPRSGSHRFERITVPEGQSVKDPMQSKIVDNLVTNPIFQSYLREGSDSEVVLRTDDWVTPVTRVGPGSRKQ